MKNQYSHIYLYAKRHYKITDVVEDLKKILENFTGCDAKYINMSDILNVLVTVAYQHINTEYQFRDFVNGLLPDQRCYIGADKDEFHIVLIKKLLSVIRLTQVKKGDQILIVIDEPDFSILPKRAEP